MPFDLASRLVPDRTAVLVFECQEGVIGPDSMLTGLANSVREGEMVAHIAALLDAARAAGSRIYYCNAAKRRDGIGNPFNTPLEIRLREKGGSGEPLDAGDVVAELAPQEGDVVIAREHGLTGFYQSPLDAYLRNTGVETVVVVGVSLNVGIMGTALEAVNRGFTVVIPTDCVAADPPEYAEPALRYTVRNLAFLSTLEEIEAAWKV